MNAAALVAMLCLCQAPQQHWITFEGVSIPVYGVRTPEGAIRWEPDHPHNARMIEAARAAARRGGRDAEPATRPQVRNYGLTPEKLGSHQDEYTAGSDTARRFVAEATGVGTPAGRLHVTVIGADADRAPVVRDLKEHPALAGLRGSLMVQDYRPDEWPVDPSLGFQTGGKPTILVQQARGRGDPRGGRVVYRAMDYAIGPEGLAEAIRRADPDYRPDLDPGPANPSPLPLPVGVDLDHLPLLAVVGLVLLVLVLPSRKEPRP